MKRVFLVLAAVLCAAPVSAATYVSGSVGSGSAGDSYKQGIPVAMALGIRSNPFRIEGAVGYQKNDIQPANGYRNVIGTYLANVYYDIAPKLIAVSPYLTAGIGGATVKIFPESTVSNSGFAWQLGAGVDINASDRLTIDLGYRYLRPSKGKTADSADISYSYSNLMAGIRIGI